MLNKVFSTRSVWLPEFPGLTFDKLLDNLDARRPNMSGMLFDELCLFYNIYEFKDAPRSDD